MEGVRGMPGVRRVHLGREQRRQRDGLSAATVSRVEGRDLLCVAVQRLTILSAVLTAVGTPGGQAGDLRPVGCAGSQI